MSKQVTNYIGLGVLGIVVFYMLASTVWWKPYFQSESSKESETVETMQWLSENPDIWGKSGKVDGWGKQMQYKYERPDVIFISAGPDGAYGTRDDIIRKYPVPKGK